MPPIPIKGAPCEKGFELAGPYNACLAVSSSYTDPNCRACSWLAEYNLDAGHWEFPKGATLLNGKEHGKYDAYCRMTRDGETVLYNWEYAGVCPPKPLCTDPPPQGSCPNLVTITLSLHNNQGDKKTWDATPRFCSQGGPHCACNGSHPNEICGGLVCEDYTGYAFNWTASEGKCEEGNNGFQLTCSGVSEDVKVKVCPLKKVWETPGGLVDTTKATCGTWPK